MGIIRIVVGACVVVVAMGLGVVSASAEDTPVVVIHEPDQVACGPCVIHATSEDPIVLQLHVPGMPEQIRMICTNEFEANVYADGSGEIYSAALAGAQCAVEPCETNGVQDQWPFNITEEDGEEWLEVRLCLQPLAPPIVKQPCTIDVHVQHLSEHVYEFTAVDTEQCHGVGENPFSFTGHWLSEEDENHEEIELIHTDDA